MSYSLATRIQLLEHIQELHQQLEYPRLHWLSPGAQTLERHLQNLPRLEIVADLISAEIVVGSCKQLVQNQITAPILLMSDHSFPDPKLISTLLLQGYRLSRQRLLQKIHNRLPESKRMRILVLTNLYPPQELGGYGRSIHDFACNLRQFGHQIFVLSSDAPYLGGDISGEVGVHRGLILMGTYKDKISIIANHNDQNKISLHNASILQTVIEQFKPDAALLGNLDMLGPECIFQLSRNRIPCWHHFGFSDPAMLPFPPSMIPLANSGYHPVANSIFTARSLSQVLVGHATIPVVYPGAQTHLFSDLQPQALGGKLQIAFAGLLIGAKGPQVLLEALALLHQMDVPFRCEIAGGHIDAHFRQKLVDFTLRAGIAPQVNFLGKLERHQLRELFSRNQIFVFPSTWQEPFGISQVEALAASLLVVSSGTGGAAETVHDDINGRCFRPSDSQHLAEVLHEIYQHPQYHEALRLRGRRLAESHFDTVRESRKLSDLMVQGVRRASE